MSHNWQNVCSEMPVLRQVSATEVPALIGHTLQIIREGYFGRFFHGCCVIIRRVAGVAMFTPPVKINRIGNCSVKWNGSEHLDILSPLKAPPARQS